jgi:hypothetical protein
MDEITKFNNELDSSARAACDTIRELLDDALGREGSKLYHGAPVWFLDGNPIAGYSIKKEGIAVLFWSGQGFVEPGLRAVGKYKAAELLVPEGRAVPVEPMKKWLAESKRVMWDYKNLAKKQGVLEKL